MKAPDLSVVFVATLALGVSVSGHAQQRYDPNNPNSPMPTPPGMLPMPTRGATYTPVQPVTHNWGGNANNPSRSTQPAYGYVPGYGPVFYPGNTIIALGDGSSSFVFGAPDFNTGMLQYPMPWGYFGLNGYMEVSPGSLTVLPTVPQYSFSGDFQACPQPATDDQSSQQPAYNVYNQYTTNNYYYGANAQAPASNQAPQSAGAQASSPGSQAASDPQSNAAPKIDGTSPTDAAAVAKALSDISRSWLRSDVTLLKKYLNDATKVDVFSGGAYQYSIESDKLASVTDGVYNNLATISFDFQVLRTLKNGDIAAFAKQVYVLRDPASGTSPTTMYVSYTLGKRNGSWVIVAIDSSTQPVAPNIDPASGAVH